MDRGHQSAKRSLQTVGLAIALVLAAWGVETQPVHSQQPFPAWATTAQDFYNAVIDQRRFDLRNDARARNLCGGMTGVAAGVLTAGTGVCSGGTLVVVAFAAGAVTGFSGFEFASAATVDEMEESLNQSQKLFNIVMFGG